MIEVELPDGSIVEFPDGTSPKDIETQLQKADTTKTAEERLKGMSSFRKSLYGVERSIDESAMGLKQMFPKALGGGMSKEEERELAIRREMEDQIPGSGVARFAGDVAQFASPGALGLQAARLAPKAAQGIAKLGAAAGVGAATGGAQAVLEGESRGENATLGGLFGLGGQAVGDAAGRVVEGVVKRSPAAQRFAERVRNKMTLGQSADRTTLPGRLVSGFEERVQGVPIVGDVVRAARERGNNAWRSDLIESVAPKGFTPTGDNTRQIMGSIGDEYSDRYTKALRNKVIQQSQPFQNQLQNIVANPRSGVDATKAQRLYESVVNNYQSRIGQNGMMTGKDAKDFESFLSSEARNYNKLAGNGVDADAGKVAKLFEDMERAWTATYYRQLGPQGRAPLKELDKTYAPFKTVERAAGARMNEGGAFTPQQLDEAVSNRTGRSKYAREKGMLQREATDGREVFGQRIPDSGTAERGALGALALGAGSFDPATAAAIGIGVPLVTAGPGKRLMTGETAAQRMLQKLRANNALRASGLPAGMAAADLAAEESERY